MSTQIETNQKLMTRPQAAHYIKTQFGIQFSPLTLEKLACQGGGPRFRRFGTRRVYYFPCDIDEWVKGRIGRSFRSTSDEVSGTKQ